MKLLFSTFIIFSLLFARAGSADGERVILILGDSLSAAYKMNLDESWPSLLQQRITEHGHAYRVFNSSIVGDTTESGLSRLPKLLAKHRPSIVIIELGGNDGLRGLPLEVTQNNLQSMINQSKDIGAGIVLAGIHLPPNYGKTYTERFSGIFVSLARDADIVFIPFLLEGIALDPSLMLEDGLHPSARAQPLLLGTVWQALEPMLQ